MELGSPNNARHRLRSAFPQLALDDVLTAVQPTGVPPCHRELKGAFAKTLAAVPKVKLAETSPQAEGRVGAPRAGSAAANTGGQFALRSEAARPRRATVFVPLAGLDFDAPLGLNGFRLLGYRHLEHALVKPGFDLGIVDHVWET
jgi:hypothetical protein